jgi:DNA-binding transcriptional LysR family regulator
MDCVQSIRVFAGVAQVGRFSAAACDLRLSGAAVTTDLVRKLARQAPP